MDNLNLAVRYQNINADEQEIPPESEPVILSLADAVDAAMHRFSADLVFGGDVNRGIEGLAEDAGPPDKVFEHLKALAELARLRRKGPLGRSIIEWLANRAIAASSESTILEGTKSERQKRTWDDGNDNKRFFTLHLKPNENTGPDLCVRIYFDYDEERQKIIVGWVGRHP